MKRTPLLFLLCLALLFFSLFHLEPSNAESESSSAVLVHETPSQQEEVDSSKSTGVNFERQQLLELNKPGLEKIPFGTEKILSATSTNPNQDQNSDITVVAS